MAESRLGVSQDGRRKVRLELQEDEWTREEPILPATIWKELGTQALADDQDDGVCDQDQGNHLLHQATALVHQLMEVE